MKNIINASLFVIVGLTIIATASACGKATAAPQPTKHELLTQNQCYEQHDLPSGHYVTVKATDLCLSIQFPNKGSF